MIGGHRAYQIARVLQGYSVIVISELDQKEIFNMNFTAAPDLDAALEQVRERRGDDFTCYVVPNGRTVMPAIHHTS
jgi:nickel-dependent lactate racemase